MTVRAKFYCDSITQYVTNKGITFRAVTKGSEENKSFAKYTPSGELRLSIDPSTPAFDAFVVGKEYYIDIQDA